MLGALKKRGRFCGPRFVNRINEEVVEPLVVVGWLALPLCLSIIE